jgi:hypothetical protein
MRLLAINEDSGAELDITHTKFGDSMLHFWVSTGVSSKDRVFVKPFMFEYLSKEVYDLKVKGIINE